MRTSKLKILSLLGLGLYLVHQVNAQIMVRTFEVDSRHFGATAKFVFTVNSVTNQLTVDIDNTHLGANNYIGTITSFGFNTPYTNTQLGNNGSDVSFTQHWTQLVGGHSQPAKWNKFDPYTLSAGGNNYSQDFGVGAGTTPSGGNPNSGIKYGEKATFVFTFQSLHTNQLNGFFDRANDLSVRWQEVGKYGSNDFCDSDAGWGCDQIPPVPEPSTYGLIGAASLLGLVVWRKRKQQNSK